MARHLATIVRHYRMNHCAAPARELEYFKSLPEEEDAVGEAAMCRIKGKKLSHQRRIPSDVLDQGRKRLLDNIAILRSASTFEALHDDIDALVGSIPGIDASAVQVRRWLGQHVPPTKE